MHEGAGLSSEVERSLIVRWVVGSIFHGVDPLSYFSFQPVHHDWCNKVRGMCYPVCGMVHIKKTLLLIDKSSLCGGSGFHFSLSEWSLNPLSTQCMNVKYINKTLQAPEGFEHSTFCLLGRRSTNWAIEPWLQLSDYLKLLFHSIGFPTLNTNS